ncbi:hypothetical protein FQA47_025126 [Oryzias melastigma]|uniref:Uncharacterized protein n=1 Tax=Oryzias melastigma TaxID=30732 RepID=A0A834C8W0_ORYME|nr:hypothetical protein FQA47_025126 [Oryzias melastigma]
MKVIDWGGNLFVRQTAAGPIGDGGMRTSLHLGGLQLTFLFFALLFLLTTVDTNPLPPTSLLPTVDRPQLESALHHLQVTLEDPRDSEPLEGWPEDLQSVILEPIEGRASSEEEGESDKPWVEEVLLRAQRGNLMDKPVAPFPWRKLSG